jgi:hypothetical protein
VIARVPVVGARLQAALDAIDHWGATDAERSEPFACDAFVPDFDRELFRAVSVDAPPEVVFRWLCQLRAAPYSYDWLDNRGRRSPRRLTPGLDDLATGQRVMTIFTLVDFAPDDHVTALTTGGVFGDVVVTYRVRPCDGVTRLVVKMRWRFPRGLFGAVSRYVLPAGDLVMMHKQLRTLGARARMPRGGRDNLRRQPGEGECRAGTADDL